MQTKREQVRAHNFQVRRLVRGVLLAAPDHGEQPFRRSATGTLVGTVIALLILAGFAVYGLLHPASGPVSGAVSGPVSGAVSAPADVRARGIETVVRGGGTGRGRGDRARQGPSIP